MKIIDYNDLKEIKLYNYGKFSWVKLIEFNGEIYCFKQFKLSFDDNTVIKKLCKFTDEEFPYYFLMPLYIVEKNNRILGYLTRYDVDLVDIYDPFTLREQYKILKSGKEHLNILHNKYNLIHGDMHFGNLKVHSNSLETYLLDFDFSYRFGEYPKVFSDFGIAVNNYLKYYPYDKNIDIYYYNLSTFLLLSKIDSHYKVILRKIMNEDYYIENENKDVKRLIKELTLSDTRKPYSGEYIIDYLNL